MIDIRPRSMRHLAPRSETNWENLRGAESLRRAGWRRARASCLTGSIGENLGELLGDAGLAPSFGEAGANFVFLLGEGGAAFTGAVLAFELLSAAPPAFPERVFMKTSVLEKKFPENTARSKGCSRVCTLYSYGSTVKYKLVYWASRRAHLEHG